MPGGFERLKQAAYRTSAYRFAIGRQHVDQLLFQPLSPWPGQAERANEIFQGRYRFAGREARAPNQPPWRLRADDAAWLSALHRFDWLADFVAADGNAARTLVRRLVRSWVDLCDAYDPLIWSPEVLGRRLFNCFGQASFVLQGGEADYRHAVLDSLGRQWRHLGHVADSAEDGRGGLDAALGYVMGGLVIPEQQLKLERGLSRLQRRLAEQVATDGGYGSRNPSEQMAVLRDLFALQEAIGQSGRAVPDWLEETMERMAAMLAMFRHGDGGLALFNDALEEAAAVAETLQRIGQAKVKPPLQTTASGFQRLVSGKSLLLADVGPPPRGALGRFAHAGTGSFEFSIGKHRLIVNCGSGRGRSGEWQAAARGTAAHSTLVLDGRNSAELMEGGGFGRRPEQCRVRRQEDEDGNAWLEFSHDGYVPLSGMTHHRRLYLAAGGGDLRGEDVLEAGGAGSVDMPFSVRFHLHPEVQASPVQGGNAVLLKVGGQGWRFRASGGTVQVEDSVYLGRRGEMRRTDQIVVTGVVAGSGATVKWAFRQV